MNQNSPNLETVAMETKKSENATFGAPFGPEGLRICNHIDNEVEPLDLKRNLRALVSMATSQLAW